MIVPNLRRCAIALTVLFISCRDNGPITPTPTVELGEIIVPGGPRVLERGEKDTLTATLLDKEGDTVAVPVVWRSANERIAIFERGGALVARDTGTTAVVAVSLGVVSNPVIVRVVWLGAGKIEADTTWSAQQARSPGATIADSVRVRVTNIQGASVAGVRVEFTVTMGGGSVSPAIDTTDANGVASAQWTLGPETGVNTVSASVIRDDGTLNPFVPSNAVTFTTTSYLPLIVERGDNQSGQILSALSETPAVKLVDSLGVPRPGVPVVFTAFSNGRVATPSVSTDANGIASPGTWTLGDLPGEQLLEARAEDAEITLR